MAPGTNLILKFNLSLLCLLGGVQIIAAQMVADSFPKVRVRDINEKRVQRSDTVWVTSGICKTLKAQRFTGMDYPVNPDDNKRTGKVPLLAVNGEAGYQYMNRSSSAAQPVLLNTRSGIASLHLTVVYKQNLPFSFSMRYNRSSPFQMDNPWEVNLGFDNQAYRELINGRIADKYKQAYELQQQKLRKEYNSLFTQYQIQKDILESPEYIQQAVEDRFRQSSSSLNVPTVAGVPAHIPFDGNIRNTIEKRVADATDSLKARVDIPEPSLHETLEKRRDSLFARVKSFQDSIERKKQDLQAGLDSVNQALAGIYSQDSLDKYAREKGVETRKKSKNIHSLILQSDLRIGKFLVNNSELTISSIFLHGGGLKLGGDRFVRVTAGTYDFAFREMFRFQQDSSTRHRPFVLAVKIGKTDGRNLRALNYYLGQKRNPGSDKLNTVTGLSYERQFFFSKRLQLDLELAKSNTRQSFAGAKDEPVLKDLLSNFNTRVFGGYGNLKANLPRTNTDLDFVYRYWGQQFDAFNGGLYYNPLHTVSARVSQFLFKKKLTINAGLRHSDFRSYGVASNLNSKTNFLNLNSTLRIRKFPVLNLGYYPGSQLYRLGDNKYYEYYYYIFNATASHYFQIKRIPFQTVFTWSKFDNRFSDSLVTGPSSTINVFLTTWVGKLSCQTGYSWQKASQLALSTWEAGLTYSGTFLRIGGTAKWNQSANMGKAGFTANISFMHPKVGTISLLADQSYLPDGLGAFIPVSTGQLQIIKPLKFRIWQKGQ